MGKLWDKWTRSPDSMLRTWSPQLALRRTKRQPDLLPEGLGVVNEITLQAEVMMGLQENRLVGISLEAVGLPGSALCDGQWPSHTQRENSRVSFPVGGKAEGLRNIRRRAPLRMGVLF